MKSRKWDRADTVGLLCIAVGLGANFLVLQKLVSPTGQMHTLVYKIAITAFDLLAVATGVFLFRRDRAKLRKDKRRALAFSLSLAFSLVALELFLRLYDDYFRPQPPHAGFLQANPHGTGSFRLMPNTEKELLLMGRKSVVRINSLGLHGPEVRREPDPGRPRVAFAGDSFTFGSFASDYDKTFVSVFQRKVKPSIEALNFGVFGYGVDDIRLYLSEEILSFHPDYLVVMIYAGNDFSDTYLGLNKRIINPDGTLVWNEALLAEKIPPEWRHKESAAGPPKNNRLGLRLIEHLESLRVANLLMDLTFRWNQRFVEKSDFTRFRVHDDFQNATFWSRKDYPPIAREAVAAVLDELARIQAICDEHGIVLALAALPSKEQVYTEQPAGADYDIAYPQKYLADFAAEQRIPYLDLQPILRRAYHEEGQSSFMNNDSHFNNTGHRLVGKALVRFFLEAVQPSRQQPLP